jgi:excinuclease ABC subunit B
VVVVASVSCIFGLGAPEDYLSMRINIAVGMDLPRERLLYQLVSIHYQRNDVDFHRGVFGCAGIELRFFPPTRRTRRSASIFSGMRSKLF